MYGNFCSSQMKKELTIACIMITQLLLKITIVALKAKVSKVLMFKLEENIL